ncbi:MAG: hypothetical protein IJZ85_13115 [Lachnospiraceae bacterium]|nr:hypothetical protein [Lachnospiraceae bacterium]
MGGCLRKRAGRGVFSGSGSMTVFFCLALLLIGAIICTCLESARTAGLRFMAKTASDSALQSVFADYHEELWEDYHVFFHHEQSDMEDALSEYLAYYEEPAKDLYGVGDYSDLWGLHVDRVRVTAKKSALSDGGRLFLEQAIEYEKYQIAKTLLEELLNRAGLLDEVDKVRTFAVRLSSCLEQIQKVSALYQDVRDSIGAVLQLGNQIRAVFSGELPDLETSYALLTELADHITHLKRSAEEYLQSANDMGDLAEKMASEFGDGQDTIYGQQISQLRAFTVNGLLGAAVSKVTQKSDGVLAQLYSVLTELRQLMDSAEEGELTAESGEGENGENEAATEDAEVTESASAAETEAESGEKAQEEAEEEIQEEAAKETEEESDDKNNIYETIIGAVDLGIQIMRELEGELDSADGADSNGEAGEGSGGDTESDTDSDAESAGADGQSLLELVKQWKNMAVLALVMGNEATQTRVDYFSEPSALPSAVATEPLTDVSVAEKGLFIFYVTDTFTSVLSAQQKNFAYQQEYILFGKSDSRSNLTAMAESLLAVREGLNLAFLLTNAQMRTLAETAAYALVGATGLYPLVLITQFVILAAWAFAESVADVRALFGGEAVSLWKTEETWKTSISGLVEEIITPETLETGIGTVDIQLRYGDYLKLFLLINDTQTLCMRSMDIIQQEIGSTQVGFLMADCCGAADVTVKYSSSYRLITLPAVGETAGGEHQIESVSSYKYK